MLMRRFYHAAPGVGREGKRPNARCRRQEEAGTKALTPALDTAMSMSS